LMVTLSFFFFFKQKVEGRVSSDEDLKLTELLRYYMLNIEAAKVR
jgi:sorting nexin-5/6/32